jgi:hypothetical protein
MRQRGDIGVVVPGENGWRRRRWMLAVSLLTLVALALRLFHIGNESLRLDEAYTLFHGSLSIGSFWWAARTSILLSTIC